MRVRGMMKCPRCGARWTLVGEQKDDDEFCPNCRASGEPEVKKVDWTPPATGGRHSQGAESQELQPLPPEQEIIRLATKKYVEVVEAFERTLDGERRAFVRCATRETLMALGKFAHFLEATGLPLEEDVKVNETLKKLKENLEASASRAAAARDAFFMLYEKELGK